MSLPHLLVIDDEQHMEWLFQHSFAGKYRISGARDPGQARKVLSQGDVDLVLLDLCLGDFNGIELLKEIKARHPGLPVLMMTAYATVQTAVEAMKAGARDYVLKPFDLTQLSLTLNAVLVGQAGTTQKRGELVAADPKMLQILQLIDRVAPTSAPVLILGESGTGKELVARAIHSGSPRAEGPFIPVNCAALPDHLLESELFGHEKGAFTGALARKPGRFELADGGTLLLDEIGDMPLPLQVKLLRVLEEHTIERVGGTQRVPVNVRILAATHRNLAELAQSGQFRSDLYYRLNVIPLHLPPLRERPGDISALCHHFLQKACERHNKAFTGFTSAALARLQAYQWPGNVRELRNLIEQVVVLWEGPLVRQEYLPDLLTGTTPAMEAGLKDQAGRVKAEFEQARIMEALAACGGNRTRAAEALGISRRALQLKLKAMQGE